MSIMIFLNIFLFYPYISRWVQGSQYVKALSRLVYLRQDKTRPAQGYGVAFFLHHLFFYLFRFVHIKYLDLLNEP